MDRQRQHSRNASLKFLQHLKEAIEEEENAADESSDADDAKSGDHLPQLLEVDTNGNGMGHGMQMSGHTHLANALSNRNISEDEQSMTPAETPMNPSDSDDNGSVDSISSNKMEEMEKRNSTIIHSQLMDDDGNVLQPSASPNPFADNFDDVADQIANKYNTMDNPELRCDETHNIYTLFLYMYIGMDTKSERACVNGGIWDQIG